jgi:hypothetical protein
VNVPTSYSTSQVLEHYIAHPIPVCRNFKGGMGKFKGGMLFLWMFFALCTIPVLKIEARISSTLEKEIEAKLKLLNKAAVKSIKVCNSITLHSA